MKRATLPLHTWLIQRLSKPHESPVFGADNPFAFGGGLRNGGLSKDAMALLRPVFQFDYMGAAEFEFGAVPEALQKIVRRKLAAFSIDIDLSTVPADWRAKKKGEPAPQGSAPVYVLCAQEEREAVAALIADLAAGNEQLKERTQLTSTLRPYSEWDGETVGWLELDNGFFFFTDEAMWKATCDLLGVAA